jgi:hypothetical protein
MPLQRIEQGGQKGDQTFGTFAIVRIPCLHERVHDLGSIARLAWMPNDRLDNFLIFASSNVLYSLSIAQNEEAINRLDELAIIHNFENCAFFVDICIIRDYLKHARKGRYSIYWS